MTTVRRALAPNGGPYTGPGTNTWVVGDGAARVVIDPGPDRADHRRAIERRLGGAAVGVVLLTHGHADHSEGAERFAAEQGARLLRHPELADGDLIHAADITLQAIFTPGHAPDHLAYWLPEDRVLFTGDLILGQGSSMVTYPDGDVAAYLRSLDRVAALEPRLLFPGHWDPVEDAAAKIAGYKAHRLERERLVVDALREAPGTPGELTERVYAGELATDPSLRQGAEMTLRAHLEKLVREGRVAVEGGEVQRLVR
ncbi:MAG: MBL fold metallo-hydrolase [Candidatus Dormibacteraceae bacterium]